MVVYDAAADIIDNDYESDDSYYDEIDNVDAAAVAADKDDDYDDKRLNVMTATTLITNTIIRISSLITHHLGSAEFRH